MPETDPILVGLQADPSDFKAGMEEAKRSVREFGNEVESTSGKSFQLTRTSTNLLTSVLALRGAFSITASVLKDFGINNVFVNSALHSMELALNIAIAALSVYRAASFLASTAAFIHAKAAFLAAIAEVSASTLFIGTAIAIGAAVAAFAIISALSQPRAQFGGIVPARVGGTSVLMGEAGQPEVILPLDKLADFGGGSGSPINVTMNVQTNDPDLLMAQLGRRIQQLKTAGA